jgi:protein tyrosine phosphatase
VVLLNQCSRRLQSLVPSHLYYKHFLLLRICGSHSFAFLPYDSHSKVVALAQKLVRDIAEGQVIYLHCWGGHGRTGTVVCIMLHLLYGVSICSAVDVDVINGVSAAWRACVSGGR